LPVDLKIAVRAMVAVVLVAVGVAGASLLQTPTYEASALVLVDERSLAQGTGNGKIQLIPLAPAPETLRALTQTMTDATDNRPVAQEAIQRLGLEMSPAELLDNLTIEQDAAPNIIALTYESTDPVEATKIVNTVSEVSSERISPISAVGSKFTATVWERAAVPESPVSPHPLRNGLLTLVIGLVLCAALRLALIHERLRRGILRSLHMYNSAPRAKNGMQWSN
jgi:capsular polysaccharide biosynthesis protein